MNITIKDIDDLKAHLAESLQVNFDKQMAPIITKIEGAIGKVDGLEATVKNHTEDLVWIKKTQAKAIAMWTIMVGLVGTGVTLLFNQIKVWVFAHLKIG